MGGPKATNTAKNVAKFITNVGVDTLQGCNTTINQSQIVSVKNVGPDGNVTIGNITESQAVSTNLDCVQSSTTQTAIDNALSQAATQAASAVNQQFSIPGTSAEADNVITQVTELKNQISLSFTQECVAIIAQDQVDTIEDVDKNVTEGNINYTQTVDAVSSCVQNSDNVTNATNSLTQTLSQTATATIENFMGPLIAIIIVIIIVFGLIIYQGEKAFTNWKTLLVILGAIVLYFVAAFILKWPPFSSSSDDSDGDNGDNGDNGTDNFVSLECPEGQININGTCVDSSASSDNSTTS